MNEFINQWGVLIGILALFGIEIAPIKINPIKKITSLFTKRQDEALKIILQTNLTKMYFKYCDIREIPDYIYKNWINQLNAYEDLGGDDYIHTLAEDIKKFKIVRTQIPDKMG